MNAINKLIYLYMLIISILLCDTTLGEPFSVSQNLTIGPLARPDPYYSSRIAILKTSATLENGSEFYLGSALFRTVSFNGSAYIYTNYTVWMPTTIYDGSPFLKETFEIYKVIDPCEVTYVTAAFAIDFPNAWTNAKDGKLDTITATEEFKRISDKTANWPTNNRYFSSDCVRTVFPKEEQDRCGQYLMWDMDDDISRHDNLYLTVKLDHNAPLSSVISRIRFRHVRSKSCPMRDSNITKKDYSFEIDFSSVQVPHTKVLLHNVPKEYGVKFIVTIDAINRTVLNTKVSIQFEVPSFDRYEYGNSYYQSTSYYLTMLLCLPVSGLFVLGAGIAIGIRKEVKRRQARRAQYEHIPDDNSNQAVRQYSYTMGDGSVSQKLIVSEQF